MLADLKVMRSTGRSKRVWIVDDDREYRAAVGDLLQCHGYAVLELADGREALDALVSGTTPAPSLIILDMEMPRLGGAEFLTIIRSYYRITSVPVLVLAARDHSTALPPDSVDGYLLKPYDPDRLVHIIKNIVERGDAALKQSGPRRLD